MKILIVHLGTITQILPATSIIKGLLKKDPKAEITWVINEKKDKYIFKYNKDIKKIISFSELEKNNEVFDALINLHPKFPHKNCENLKIKNAFDYDFSDEFKNFTNVLIGEESISNMNIFQVYYKLSGLVWKGEGYSIPYYPKTKTKQHRVGLGVAHAHLRDYVRENIDIKGQKLWHIPFKKNIYKKMDEINRCKKIITDDLLTFHLAMALHKYVYFLQTFPLNTKVELFKKGEICKVSPSFFLK